MTITNLKDLRQGLRANQLIYKLLSTVIGECEQVSKNPSENDILKVIRKIYKDNFDTIKLCEQRKIDCYTLKLENEFLVQFLPKQLTENELEAIINAQIAAGEKMPGIMKYLSSNYKDRYDGKVAARICNLYLNGIIL